jgi:hypothetical protein
MRVFDVVGGALRSVDSAGPIGRARGFSARRCQPGQLQEVVRRRRGFVLLPDLAAADEPGRRHSADGLAPADQFLDPLASPLTDRVALGFHPPLRPPAGVVGFGVTAERALRQWHVRRDAVALQRDQERTFLVVAVGTECLGPQAVMFVRALQHDGCGGFCWSVSRRRS